MWDKESYAKMQIEDNKKNGLSCSIHPVISMRYFAWLSSKQEKKEYKKQDVLYAGLVCDIPSEYKCLVNPYERRKYCIVTKSC